MNKKLPRLLQPNVRLFFFILIAFAIATFFIGEHNRLLAGAMFTVIILAAVFLQIASRSRTVKLLNYLESISGNMDLTVRETPLPVLIHNSETGEIIWSNERFNDIANVDEPFFQRNIADIIPNYTWDWLLDGLSECKEPVQVGDKLYSVYGSVVLSEREYIAMTYWIDVTQFNKIQKSYKDSRLIITLITIDNYDELLKGLDAKEKSLILSEIDENISTWVANKDGYMCKYDRDRYFFLFEERHFEEVISDNFSILENVSKCRGSGGIQATLSIGIGKDGSTPHENYRFASISIEMALSRGGNQAVVRNIYGFEFYGGRPQQVERRTKVKARVMASALGELINDATKIYVMGHKTADYDSLGSALGVCCIARSKGKKAYIVINDRGPVQNVISSLMEYQEYNDVFLSEQDAIIEADNKTLLVVVDVSRFDKVESSSLLLSCTSTAIIDHHRRSADYIDDAIFNFHEPYASSTSELVADMMQYLVERTDILRIEAEALLAGIVLDTKGFIINTGSGTFDAAAYLKRVGADATSVKRMMQSDIRLATSRYDLMREASIYRAGITLAVSNKQHSRTSIAQASDELLSIKGVHTSFAIAKDGDTVYVSGRSIGNVNVQVILEKLGGGGSQATAGLQVEGGNSETVATELKKVIDDYIKKNKTLLIEDGKERRG
ncbi:MAG: DHH family phosphoesterase [Oscillospiraceae bacterium]|jgi:c-di-AMP phosphodiesterase-like protein|nr:DHH family phosphoesterase [Oscillospiraceae bacterium]